MKLPVPGKIPPIPTISIATQTFRSLSESRTACDLGSEMAMPSPGITVTHFAWFFLNAESEIADQFQSRISANSLQIRSLPVS